MKRILLIAALAFTSFQIFAQQMDSLSYSLGVLLAQNLKTQGISADDLSANDLGKGISDVLAGADLAVDLETANMTVSNYMTSARDRQAVAAVQRGQDFLAKNKTRSEVKTTDSGLQYEVLKEGSGAKPKASDKVTVHYTGTLIDGTVFDSSVERGQPASFPVNGVIPGWVEALQLMPTGSKWKLFIPSDLAYGERGAGANIGPNETLVFEVELLEIN